MCLSRDTDRQATGRWVEVNTSPCFGCADRVLGRWVRVLSAEVVLAPRSRRCGLCTCASFSITDQACITRVALFPAQRLSVSHL